jgi:hypothetical protein
MRCDEVIRELAVPTDDRDSAALAEHLANCPSCAVWAKRDADFDRLWDATRPVEPSFEAWNSVWCHIASSIDSKTPEEFKAYIASTVPLNGSVYAGDTPFGLSSTSSRSRSWNWAAIGLIGLAQAAVVLLAVGWAWYISSRSDTVEIEAGRWVVIRVEGSAVKVVDLTPDAISYNVDDWLLAFNAAEAIPNPVVAMKE